MSAVTPLPSRERGRGPRPLAALSRLAPQPVGKAALPASDHLGLHRVVDRPGADRGPVLVQREPLAHGLGRASRPAGTGATQSTRSCTTRTFATLWFRASSWRARTCSSPSRSGCCSRSASPAGAAAAPAPSNFLMLFPLVTPEIVMGVSLLLVFTHIFTFVHTGTIAQILGHVTFSISFVVVIVRGRLFSIGTQYEEAAADLGASPCVALRSVLLPLLTAGDRRLRRDRVRDLDRRLRHQPVAVKRRAARHRPDPDLRRDARRAVPVGERDRNDHDGVTLPHCRGRLPRLARLHPRRAPRRGKAAEDFGGVRPSCRT